MYEPVKYDKSITKVDDHYIAQIQYNDITTQQANTKVLKDAQKILSFFPSDVYDGPDVPWSVFYPGR